MKSNFLRFLDKITCPTFLKGKGKKDRSFMDWVPQELQIQRHLLLHISFIGCSDHWEVFFSLGYPASHLLVPYKFDWTFESKQAPGEDASIEKFIPCIRDPRETPVSAILLVDWRRPRCGPEIVYGWVAIWPKCCHLGHIHYLPREQLRIYSRRKLYDGVHQISPWWGWQQQWWADFWLHF